MFLQLVLGKRSCLALGRGRYTSSNALDLHCNDLTQPAAINDQYQSFLSPQNSFWASLSTIISFFIALGMNISVFSLSVWCVWVFKIWRSSFKRVFLLWHGIC